VARVDRCVVRYVVCMQDLVAGIVLRDRTTLQANWTYPDTGAGH
jgi:hypothetical protein